MSYGVGEEKTSSDLMGPDLTIEWDGIHGKVKGPLKNISEPWEGYGTDPENNTGHFLAIELDEQYEGEKITVIGKRQKTETDRYWVLRKENAKNGKFTFKKGSETLFDLDLSETTDAA